METPLPNAIDILLNLLVIEIEGLEQHRASDLSDVGQLPELEDAAHPM